MFPKLKKVQYIQRTKYKRAKSIISNSSNRHFLVLREFDQQLEHEVKSFAASFPQTVPIIVFRKHDSYAASQYRRFVKNGFRGSITDFIDIENDGGHFKKADFTYLQQIHILERYFNQVPIVLFYEDMRDNPSAFVLEFAKSIQAEIDVKDIDFSRKHTSYSEQQLKVMLALSRKFNLRNRKVSEVKLLQSLWSLGLKITKYAILFFAQMIPNGTLSQDPLIAKADLERISAHFKDDWEQTRSYAQTLKEKRSKRTIEP